MRTTSPGVVFIGVLAILFALVGAFGAKKYLQQESESVAVTTTPSVETIRVLVAAQDLPEGRKVADGDFVNMALTEQQIDQQKIEWGFMERPSQLTGRTLRSATKKGQAFYPDSFYPEGIGPTVQNCLTAGQRAVSIPFAGSAAEAGLITPGAAVDVLFRTDADAELGLLETTMTLLENVSVLAVNRQTVDGTIDQGTPPSTVTLSVTPVQARALHVVNGRGTMTLVLRNAYDEAISGDETPTTLPELLGMREPKAPQRTDVWRRGQLTTVIHGKNGPMMIEQAPYGMPVVGRPRPTPAVETSQVPATAVPANNTQANNTSSCNQCEAQPDHSALVSSRVYIRSGQ